MGYGLLIFFAGGPTSSEGADLVRENDAKLFEKLFSYAGVTPGAVEEPPATVVSRVYATPKSGFKSRVQSALRSLPFVTTLFVIGYASAEAVGCSEVRVAHPLCLPLSLHGSLHNGISHTSRKLSLTPQTHSCQVDSISLLDFVGMLKRKSVDEVVMMTCHATVAASGIHNLSQGGSISTVALGRDYTRTVDPEWIRGSFRSLWSNRPTPHNVRVHAV